MSQVQPPRERPSNARPATIQVLRWTIINVGALIVTALLVRVAIVYITADPAQRGLKAVVQITAIAIWPLAQIPTLSTPIRGALNLADLLTLGLACAAWIAGIGVVAGWEHEGVRMGLQSNEERIKP